MSTILVLDDEAHIANAMARVIARIPDAWLDEPCRVVKCDDPMQALVLLEEQAFNVVISDLRMPGMDGLSFLTQVRDFQPEAKRIMISGQGDLPAVLASVNEVKVFRFVTKPWNDLELQSAVIDALQAGKEERENRELADQVRVQRGSMSRQVAELRSLESECPGITQLQRDADGSIWLDESSVG